MKKLIGAVVAIAVTAALMGCGSTKGIASGVEQAKQSNNPGWAQVSGAAVTFTDSEAKLYNAIETGERGMYASGMSESLGSPRVTASAANLTARTELGRYVGSQMLAARNRMDEAGRTKYAELNADRVDSLLVGSRAVDSFVDDTGNVWVLMFVSTENLRKSYAGTDLEELANFMLADFSLQNSVSGGATN